MLASFRLPFSIRKTLDRILYILRLQICAKLGRKAISQDVRRGYLVNNRRPTVENTTSP